MEASQLEEIADRLFAAFVAHDFDEVKAIMTPDAVITQNGVGSRLPEALDGIAALRDIVGDHQYEDVRRVVGANAVSEEHRVVSTTPTGLAVDLPACVVLRFNEAGLVSSLDEYVDISTFAQPAN